MKRIEVPDGRVVEYLVEGPVDGLPLVFHHGTPVAGVPMRSLFDAAIARGMRVIAHSRPGYGDSTERIGRRVADVASDVSAVLAAENATRFVTLGWSGGGPHALACAALLPDRCAAAAAVAGIGPYDAPGLDFLDGTGEGNIEEYGAAVGGFAELDKLLDERAPFTAQARAERMAELFGDNLSEADRVALVGEMPEYLAAGARHAVSTGVAGWRDDDLAFVAGWGFSLDTVRVPVSIWHGDQDRFVPFAHGRWLAAHVPGAEAHLRYGTGHFPLMADPGPILDRLAGHGRTGNA